jgi:protein FAM32A
MSEYEVVQKGALKLKGVAADSGIKKKKKKSKHKKRDLEEAIANIDEVEAGPSGGSQAKVIPSDDSKVYYGGKTNAEIAFLKKKEERDIKRIKDKASVSHKERVEKFNTYLDSLSEHYEPAKVSWTK